MNLLGQPVPVSNPNEVASKLSNSPSPSKRSKREQDKKQEDYKRQIIALEIQNQKYRSELYQLGQTVNKILDKIKKPQPTKNYAYTPNLDLQLELSKKELANVNQFIEIYHKELDTLGNKKRKDQVENLAATEELLKSKTAELAMIKKQVKQMSHKNKALQCKLFEYNKKNKAKSVDKQALQLRDLINENKALKAKYEDLQALQQKKQKWLQNNIKSTKQLQQRVYEQQSRLPRIQSKSLSQKKPLPQSSSQPQSPGQSQLQLQTQPQYQKSITRERQRASSTNIARSSLPKLQNQKKIYTKWIETATANGQQQIRKNPQLEKELQDLQKINRMVQEKLKHTSEEIRQIQRQIDELKAKVEDKQMDGDGDQNKSKGRKSIPKQKQENPGSLTAKFKPTNTVSVGTMVTKKSRRMRKDWVGKLDGVRFSDNRYVREQSRLYKVLFNSMGYYQFTYYSIKDPKRHFTSKLPFDASKLSNPGKQSIMTVQAPDFIKNIDLKFNNKTGRVTEMILVSNLGVKGQFRIDPDIQAAVAVKQSSSSKSLGKDDPIEVSYKIDIKTNEAITYVFGSYGLKLDEKKNVSHAWLEGFGVEMIEDFVEELI